MTDPQPLNANAQGRRDLHDWINSGGLMFLGAYCLLDRIGLPVSTLIGW